MPCRKNETEKETFRKNGNRSLRLTSFSIQLRDIFITIRLKKTFNLGETYKMTATRVQNLVLTTRDKNKLFDVKNIKSN